MDCAINATSIPNFKFLGQPEVPFRLFSYGNLYETSFLMTVSTNAMSQKFDYFTSLWGHRFEYLFNIIFCLTKRF